MNIKARQFRALSKLVYDQCGINLHQGKQQLLAARLAKRLRSTGIRTIDEYLNVLEWDNQELKAFLDAISTNHTYFFREDHHFEYLGAGHLKIWCAACSSGEEPYSIAIYCLEQGFNPAILATDLSTNALGVAKKGIYSMDKARNVPQPMLERYFQKGYGKWKGHVRIKEEVRKMVTSQRLNLLTDPPPAGGFDVIFCRNVFIYFDSIVAEKVVAKLYRVLKWNGYLIIGGAESLSNVKHEYSYSSPSIYRKIKSPS